jgi:predicted permease
MLRDLKLAVRMLLKTRGWTAVVLVSLALGIGANAALFTAVNGILLQSLPVPQPETLVRLKWAGSNDMVRSSSDYGSSAPENGRNVRTTFSVAIVQALRAANQTLTGLVACAPMGSFNVVINGEAEIASAFGVSGNYFRVLGVPPALGRLLSDDDDRAGAPAVAVISHAYWRRRFGSDSNAITRVVTVNNVPVTIVGVTPEDFTGVQRLGATAPDVTVSLALDSQFNVGQTRSSEPTYWWLQMLGRLEPGVTYEQVRGNLEGVFPQTARNEMDSYTAGLTDAERRLSSNQRRRTAVPQLLVSDGRRGVYDLDTTSARSATYLMVVVLLVLLIVCANVANLLLSRATVRQREISVRLSVGATRGRIIRQLLTESLLLSCFGGALGVLVGYWSRQLLPFGQNAAIDWRVMAFIAGLSVLTGIVFGVVPAFRATRLDLAGAMKENSRSVVGSRNFLSKALLVVQVALSLVLVIGAGLFLRTLHNLRAVDVGFNPRNLLMFTVNPQLNRYDTDRTAELYRRIQDGLGAIPGVRRVALTRMPLLSGSASSSTMHVQGGGIENDMYMMTVSPEFFEAMEIPVLRGRGFTDRDSQTSPRVAVINEAAARHLFPKDSPIGRRIGHSPEESGQMEIIGVIRDTKYRSVRDAAPPTLYQSYLQNDVRAMSFILRTAGDPNALIEPMRAAVRQVDSNVPVTGVATQMEQVERRFAQERLFALAYSLFGGLALLLACIGLFGLMSYTVSRRTKEIGIRMALGAGRSQVARMVLGESLLLVGAGLVLGLTGATVAGRWVESVLFGLTPTDGATIATAVGLIIVVSMLAGYLPARRASRVDPMVALHGE